ncbi:MAG TPA: DUF58 domain-containing protein [Chitinophagaceae bacterium]|nr:DUF58 domain-containing protein [Chitinophagaceae bacterium]
MRLIKKYIGDLFLTNRFYMVMVGCILFFVVSFFFPSLGEIPKICFQVFLVLVLLDYFFLFFFGRIPSGRRIISERLSNGDDNKIELRIRNEFSFPVHMQVIDELPEQFQVRDFKKKANFKAKGQQRFIYSLRPVERGEYYFGNILFFVSSLLGLLMRRITIDAEEMIPVYPSFIQLRKYDLLSGATIQTETGSKRLRKIGHSMEFEQIKEYVHGDDIRTLNWKASARKGGLMVNTYTDEKSQQVYCIIDKGRLMKMPFGGLTLLDYAINSCLVLSNVCLKKQDRVGVITFSNKLGSVLAADRKAIQKNNILQLLYNQKTSFMESDFEMLYMQIRNRIKHRSLVVLFTNFESLSGLKRQLDYLRSIASHHLLLVVFFENTELHQLTVSEAKNIEQVYVKTIAEKFAFEKRLIVKELMKHGILSILTSPQKLTINTLNKYLELKARQAI